MSDEFLTEIKMSYEDLYELSHRAYKACGYKIKNFKAEPESAMYQACEYELNSLSVKFRSAKITPTKIGQFVTFWNRSKKGPIQPFDVSDGFDVLVVCVKAGKKFGQFIFPRSELLKQDIISQKRNGGRRAFRVYPPWDMTTSAQAKKSQNWQLNFFHDLSDAKNLDVKGLKKLLDL